MSIRLRLAVCYGGLFALILPLTSLLGYAIHTRSQYDDLDRTLVVSAGHAAAEAALSASGPHLVQGSGGLEIALRLYRPDGVLVDSTSGTKTLPSIDPRIVLRTPASPAYDAFAQVIPPLMTALPISTHGAFGLIPMPEQRWRAYVLPMHNAGVLSGYIEALTPLGHLDASVEAFQFTLPILGLVSLIVALGGSWAIAGNALRPVAKLIQTAQTIALSHDLSRRVEAPSHHDELGRLAETFNEMLGSIETAYHAQQRFVSDASHELRTPLTVIQANMELLRRHKAMPEAEREEAMEDVERETNRLTRLVADLLVLARADTGIALKHRPIELDATVLEVFHTAHQLAHGQALVLDAFEPASVEGDEDRIKQLILILLDNAIKYTPTNGQVAVSLQCQDTHAEVKVRDTGVGIPASDLPHVFERFYRTDPARSCDPGGTGLGLSVARWIVEQHGGKITLESQSGQGTLAVVYLPLPGRSPLTPL